MSKQEAGDSQFSKWLESSPPPDDDLEIVRSSAARARAGRSGGRDSAPAERAVDGAAALYGRAQATQPSVFAKPRRARLPAAGGGECASANRARLRHDDADRRRP